MSESTDLPAQAAAASEWFCDQCGSRYPLPGQCANQHPPVDLKPVSESTSAELEPEATETTNAQEPPLEPDTAPADPVAPVEPAAPADSHPFQSTIDELEKAIETLRSLKL